MPVTERRFQTNQSIPTTCLIFNDLFNRFLHSINLKIESSYRAGHDQPGQPRAAGELLGHFPYHTGNRFGVLSDDDEKLGGEEDDENRGGTQGHCHPELQVRVLMELLDMVRHLQHFTDEDEEPEDGEAEDGGAVGAVPLAAVLRTLGAVPQAHRPRLDVVSLHHLVALYLY